MYKNSMLLLSLLVGCVHLATADQEKDSGIFSFKELGQLLDELAEQAEHVQPQVSFNVQPFSGGDFVVKPTGDANAQVAEIQIKVPNVENSEEIRAHVNAAKRRSKIIVPQKGSITKVIISQDQNSVQKITTHHSQEQKKSKHGQSYHMSSGTHMEMRTLPFPIDLSQQKVEYKDNDMLIITLPKAKEVSVKKAQPRIIPVTNK